MTKANVGAMALQSHRWIDQFKDAMNVNGGDLETASFMDYLLHFLTFGWKVSNACLDSNNMFLKRSLYINSLKTVETNSIYVYDLYI